MLEIRVRDDFELKNKLFSGIILKKGFYYYCGSAQKNLSHRINRHLRKDKILHWHIDYITSQVSNTITKIFIFPFASKSFECNLTKWLIDQFDLLSPVAGFGNSDCKRCLSHLLFSPKAALINMKDLRLNFHGRLLIPVIYTI